MRKLLMLMLGLAVFCTQVLAQSRTISGRVTDENGNAAPGISILIRGSRTGTTTDNNGNFSLTVPADARALVLSGVGFTTQEVSLGSESTFAIRMQQGNQNLQEVVVTGYSTERKRNYAGAASQVTASEIKNNSLGSFDQMLQGRVPGLLSLAGSGQPGADARVQIRGAGSISGSNDPLYILDGVPIEAGLFRGLNTNDFETITVLKDAAATAQYGSRASNGVIVITSKRGRAGETRVTVRTQYGQSNRTRSKFEMMNSAQRLQFEEIIGSQNPGNASYNFAGWFYSPKNPANASLPAATKTRYAAILDSMRQINVDWQDIFFRTGVLQQHEVEVSGGTEKTRMLLSANFYKQEGIALRSDLKRYNLRANVDHTSGRLRLSNSLNLNFNKSNFVESENAVALANPFAAAFLALPYQRFRDVNNDTVITGGGFVGANAYDRILNATSLTNQLKAVEALDVRFRILDWLTARTTLGIDYRQSDNSRFIKPDSYTGFQVAQGRAGSYTAGMSRYFNYTTTNGFDLQHNFNSRHDFRGILLYEFFREYDDNFSYTGFGINPKLPNTPVGITPGNTTNNMIPTVGGGKNSTALESFIGMLTYTLDNKYTFQASGRRDGTTKASPENKYVTLYGLGASWLLTGEDFMESIGALNYAKLRVSYGVTANNNGFPQDWGFLSTYGNTNYGGTTAIAPNFLGNKSFGWEKNRSTDIGLDFGLFRDRISGTFDVYKRETEGLFVTQRISAYNGFMTLPLNAGEVANKGIEWDVRGSIVRTPNFEWSVNINGNYNKNEVTSLGQVNEFPSGTAIIREGLPLGTHYIQKWGGVDPQTGEPLYYDANGKLTTNYSQAVQLAEFGTYNPPHIGGFGSEISFKGLVLSAFFTYAKGYSRFNNESFFYEYGNSPNVQFNQSVNMLNIWQKPGDATDYQSSRYTRQFSSKDIEDASFLRFRDLTMSYSLQRSLLNRIPVIKNAIFYVKGTNLYTWTKWRGFDPEDNNNIAQYEYPLSRTITTGIDITF